MRKIILAGGLFAIAGCSAEGPTGSDGPQETSSVSSPIASVMGGIEAAIDAPWRLEPDANTASIYPTIPIIVSIHDASMQEDPATTTPLGNFCELTIREEGFATTTVYGIGLMHEIERSDVWRPNDDVAANHRLCRKWAGENCANVLDVGSSAEWHGTVLYAPHQLTAGADVHLTVQARVAQAGQSCGNALAIVENAPFDHFGVAPGNPGSYVITNRLSVHLGEAPLPKFDDGWVYGDLHYHSQGTDNEGESAYAYRPTLQAMRAMGLDFLFATDHASASQSGQTTDIDEIYVDNIQIPWVPTAVEQFLDRLAASHAIGAHTENRAARDMNAVRWSTMRSWLNDPSGANAQVMLVPGRTHAPRMFLGGEVDVIPEISLAEKNSGHLLYGNGRSFDWGASCYQVPSQISSLEQWTSVNACHPYDLAEPRPDPNRFSVLDVQGLDELYYARQHMVHLPVDPARTDAFIPSSTSLYGGATRHLDKLIQDEYETAQKGYAFLAHPVAAASGSGVGRLGPDIVPYSDIQLRTAFESQHMLGLQLWNEDTRARTDESLPGFPFYTPFFGNQWGYGHWSAPSATGYDAGVGEAYAALHDGAAAWDKMLLWGIRPSQTSTISWLAPGAPRRVFMAGGSDAHGDWNYRREGSVSGTSGAVDSAIGKPRNLVYVGNGRPETVNDAHGNAYGALGQSQVTTALATGNFSVTDGPALRILADADANGVVDANDVTMGGTTHTAAEGGTIPFFIEWKSTAEFGPVTSIDLYVGATNDATDQALVYAPLNHGPHSAYTLSGTATSHPYLEANGTAHTEMWDGYMVDPTGNLHITPSASEGMSGHRVVYLRPNDYRVGKRRVQRDEPVCKWSIECNKPGYGELCEETCTDPQPTYHFDSPSRASRIFVRAFARTGVRSPDCSSIYSNTRTLAEQTGQCTERLAYTNPIWAENYVAGSSPPVVPVPVGASCSAASAPCAGTAICAVVGGGTCAIGMKCPHVCTIEAPIGGLCSDSVPCSEGVCTKGRCVASTCTGLKCL